VSKKETTEWLLKAEHLPGDTKKKNSTTHPGRNRRLLEEEKVETVLAYPQRREQTNDEGLIYRD